MHRRLSRSVEENSSLYWRPGFSPGNEVELKLEGRSSRTHAHHNSSFPSPSNSLNSSHMMQAKKTRLSKMVHVRLSLHGFT